MARMGRLTLKNLRVPESDPLWAHFQYKSSTRTLVNNSQSSASSLEGGARPSSSSNPSAEDILRTSTSDAPKRGVSSREIKEKKVKRKSDPKAEIHMKDESRRASIRPPESGSESRRLSDSTKEVLPARRQPLDASRPTKLPVRQDVEKESSHIADGPEKTAYQELKRAHRQSELRASDSEKGLQKERTKAKERAPRKDSQDDGHVDSKSKYTSKRKTTEDIDSIDNAIRRAIEEDEDPSSKLSSKRKVKEDSDYVEPKPLKRRATEDIVIDSRGTSSKRKPRDDDEYVGPKSTVSKRKQVETDDDYYEPFRQKKQKNNRDSLSSTISSRDERQKEPALSKKQIVDSRPENRGVPRDKARKVSPPSPQRNSTTDHHHPSQSASPLVSGSNSSKQTKLRRKSPVYTSSDDEKEPPLNKRVPVKTCVVPPVDNAVIKVPSITRNKSLQPVSSDYASLRARYNMKYVEYLSVMQQLMVQRGKLDSMLKSAEMDNSGSITDSEGDVELLSFEELESLTVDYKTLHGELEGIKRIFDAKGESGAYI